jgi:hypothetical protein
LRFHHIAVLAPSLLLQYSSLLAHCTQPPAQAGNRGGRAPAEPEAARTLVQVTNKCTAGNTTLLISAIYAFGGTAYGGTEFCDNEDAADSGVCVESLMDRGGTPGNQE